VKKKNYFLIKKNINNEKDKIKMERECGKKKKKINRLI